MTIEADIRSALSLGEKAFPDSHSFEVALSFTGTTNPKRQWAARLVFRTCEGPSSVADHFGDGEGDTIVAAVDSLISALEVAAEADRDVA